MAQLVEIIATDKIILPGLLFPAKSNKVAIWLHGMGDNAVFYKTRLINEMAKSFNQENIGFLAFNNRGAHHRKTLHYLNSDEKLSAGWTNELIKECLYDINGAIDFVQNLNYQIIYLVGHSTGANKAVLYNYYQPENHIKKFILLGPGDDTGLYALKLKDNFFSSLKIAQEYVNQNKNYKIMPKYTGLYPISAQSSLDILNPDGDYNIFPYYEILYQSLGHKKLFRELQSISQPTLIVYGQNDQFILDYGGFKVIKNILWDHLLKQQKPIFDIIEIENADHSFYGYEKELAQKISSWVNKYE